MNVSDIKISDYNVAELVIQRLHAAGWTSNIPAAKGNTSANQINLDWTRLGREKAKELRTLLGELGYFPESNGRKVGELELLCGLLGRLIK